MSTFVNIVYMQYLTRYIRRCLIDFEILNPLTNTIIGIGKVPVLSLSGVGKWCDVLPPIVDSEVSKPFRGLEGNNDKSIGSIWLACGLDIKEETIPVPPSPLSTSEEDEIETVKKENELMMQSLPPVSPEPKVTSKPKPEIGKLYLIITEGINFPQKPKTVSYFIAFKSKSKKISSKPCLMSKNNNSHPIWNEHLELEDVEVGEILKINVIDVKEETSLNRLIGTAEVKVENGECFVGVEVMDQEEKNKPTIKINLLWNPEPTDLVEFKGITFRQNLIHYNSLLADIPPLSVPNIKHFKFKDRPECVAFTKWSENDAFMKRDEVRNRHGGANGDVLVIRSE